MMYINWYLWNFWWPDLLSMIPLFCVLHRLGIGWPWNRCWMSLRICLDPPNTKRSCQWVLYLIRCQEVGRSVNKNLNQFLFLFYCFQHWCKIFFKRRKSYCVIFKWIVNMQIWEGNWYNLCLIPGCDCKTKLCLGHKHYCPCVTSE